MELKDLKILLESAIGSGKVAYRSFPVNEAPKLPFICYLVEGSNNFIADNKVYKKITIVNVELYTEIKDINAENAVENALDNASIVWEKSEDYIDDEQIYEIVYTIEI